MMTLAEITYPRIDPILVRIGPVALRWYGVSYVLAFFLAYLVLHRLAKKKLWPIEPERVGDVLFWGILGVFLGGRIGYVLIYMKDATLSQWIRVWEGGMSFHGGLIGVILAYWIYGSVTKMRFRDLADGLAVATPPGIFCVRIANFINAELFGRPWDGPWAMRFPTYHLDGGEWDGSYSRVARHPSQLYEALGEGLLLFLIVRWLMVRRRWGGGTVASAFLMAYGAIRFCIEFTREPDKDIGYEFFGLKRDGAPLFDWTRGQELCLGMIAVGLVSYLLLRRSAAKPAPVPEMPAGS